MVLVLVYYNIPGIVLMRLYLVLTPSQGWFVILIEIFYKHNLFYDFQKEERKTFRNQTTRHIWTHSDSNSE